MLKSSLISHLFHYINFNYPFNELFQIMAHI
jgi:hypothetical protein